MSPEPNSVTQLFDEAARQRIASDLDTTLFVEAGAGSGKTTALVTRLLHLIKAGHPLREIAVITFTDKAAAELRDRVGQELQKSLDVELSDLHRERLNEATSELDAAAISTLHSFAQRILLEHPLEAGLPPRVEVLDTISASLAFEEQWQEFLGDLLANSAAERTLLVALEFEYDLLENLRALGQNMAGNWDLVRSSSFDERPLALPLDAIRSAAHQLESRRQLCSDADDLLVGRLNEISTWVDQLSDDLDIFERIRVLSDRPNTGRKNVGKAGNWGAQLSEVRAQRVALLELIDTELARLKDNTIQNLAAHVQGFVLASAELRRRSGRVTFDDLLVLARNLLRDSSSARQSLQAHYQRLLIDEFQDTDPIQVELAVLLGSHDPPGPWQQMKLAPGRLFFVGDPKQSIYRFRRADIGMYLETASSIAAEDRINLTTNFRSNTDIIDWLNPVFEQLIDPKDAGQPAYQPLEAGSGAPVLAGPAVTLLGAADLPDARAAELNETEARQVAYSIQTILHDQWEIDDGGVRPATAADIAILLPSRTSLRALEMALRDTDIAYRTDAIGHVYHTSEIRDLMAALRAIDDPNDELSIATALRSPLYGCGDDDLYRFATTSSTAWNYLAPTSTNASGPVVDGLRHLRELHELRHHLSPDQIVARVLDDRRSFEAAFAHKRPRDIWHRYRFVLDQARAFTEAEAGDLRQFLAWVRVQSTAPSPVSETVLPETDEDAVRIMTIHASKGLEFPIVICSGMTKTMQNRATSPMLVTQSGAVEIRLGGSLKSSGYDDAKELEKDFDASEERRSVYVAATRARDHLLISAVRSKGTSRASRIWTASRNLDAHEPDLEARPLVRRVTPLAPQTPKQREQLETQWKARHESISVQSRTATTVNATAIAHAADDLIEKFDTETTSSRGALGTSIGRAVHAVLEEVDFHDASQINELAALHAEAENVAESSALIGRLARSAWESPVLRLATGHSVWRELFIATEISGKVFEGFVDLLIRTPDGLIVIDYKTDIVRDGTEQKLRRYTPQIASYGLALEQLTGENMHRLVFVFCDEQGAQEVDVGHPAAEIAAVATLIPTVSQTSTSGVQ